MGQDDQPRSVFNNRNWILLLWTFGFLANVLIVLYASLYFFRLPGPVPEKFYEPMVKIQEDIISSYGIYLTTILTFFFGKRTVGASDSKFLGRLALLSRSSGSRY